MNLLMIGLFCTLIPAPRSCHVQISLSWLKWFCATRRKHNPCWQVRLIWSPSEIECDVSLSTSSNTVNGSSSSEMGHRWKLSTLVCCYCLRRLIYSVLLFTFKLVTTCSQFLPLICMVKILRAWCIHVFGIMQKVNKLVTFVKYDNAYSK